jgi:hypothetical protein
MLSIKEYEEIVKEIKTHFSTDYGSDDTKLVIHFVKALLAKYIAKEIKND